MIKIIDNIIDIISANPVRCRSRKTGSTLWERCGRPPTTPELRRPYLPLSIFIPFCHG